MWWTIDWRTVVVSIESTVCLLVEALVGLDLQWDALWTLLQLSSVLNSHGWNRHKWMMRLFPEKQCHKSTMWLQLNSFKHICYYLTLSGVNVYWETLTHNNPNTGQCQHELIFCMCWDIQCSDRYTHIETQHLTLKCLLQVKHFFSLQMLSYFVISSLAVTSLWGRTLYSTEQRSTGLLARWEPSQ